MQLTEKFNLDKLYFTSDPHFFHEYIIEYCNRPFSCSQEQTDRLIENWNNKVDSDGDVFMVGDFAFTGNIEIIGDLISKLNGRLWWILGNHDLRNRLNRDVIKEMVGGRQMDVASLLLKNDNDTKVFVSHYPHMFWPKHHYHVHGHVHSGPKTNGSEKVPFNPLMYDVGVDNNNFEPVSYWELMDIFKEQKSMEIIKNTIEK